MGSFRVEGISISAVLPMYNERENIANTISNLRDAFSSIGADYEIIVCDDGSCDGSDRIAQNFSKENDRIRLISYSKNRGYGYALRLGFSSATKDFVMYTDSDLPCDVSVLGKSLHLLNKVDALLGFRNSRDNLVRKFYSIAYNTIIRRVFSIRIKDVNFSFKVFRREIINNLKLKSIGPFIDAEMVSKAIKLGYRIEEIPMQYCSRKHGKSKLSSLNTILFIIREMIKLYPEIMKMGNGTSFGNKIHGYK